MSSLHSSQGFWPIAVTVSDAHVILHLPTTNFKRVILSMHQPLLLLRRSRRTASYANGLAPGTLQVCGTQKETVDVHTTSAPPATSSSYSTILVAMTLQTRRVAVDIQARLNLLGEVLDTRTTCAAWEHAISMPFAWIKTQTKGLNNIWCYRGWQGFVPSDESRWVRSSEGSVMQKSGTKSTAFARFPPPTKVH